MGERMIDVDRLWNQYERRPTKRVRTQLIEHYVGLVDNVASSVAFKLPKTVERDDLVSAGYLGLMDAVDKFEPSRGLKFETYAVNRVRGAMLDELRLNDWVPRSVRSRNRQMDTAAQGLQEQFGRPADDQEIADELDVDISKVRADRASAASSRMVPLDQMVSSNSDSEDSMMLMDILSDERDDITHLDGLFDSTVEAVGLKDGREAIVISLYYYEGLTLAEIGRVLGVTESRVCQIHTKAISDLDITA